MADGKNWFDTGFDGAKREEDRLLAKQGPGRFYVPDGESKEVVYVDDNPFCIYEHHFKMNGSWRNWMTCLRGIHDDAACCTQLGDKTRGYIGFLTCVDASKWKDKKGNAHQYEVQLFGAKLKTLKKFKRKKEDRGSLVGCMFKATREDEKSPSCGDEFEFQKEVDLQKVLEVAMFRGRKLLELYAKANSDPKLMDYTRRIFQVVLDDKGKIIPKLYPFNYIELLKPQSPDEVRIALGGQKLELGDGAPAAAATEDDTTSGTQADDVPF
jgi:hypothetical protein